MSRNRIFITTSMFLLRVSIKREQNYRAGAPCINNRYSYVLKSITIAPNSKHSRDKKYTEHENIDSRETNFPKE